MSLDPATIMKAVDSVFKKYDLNRNNQLEPKELLGMINTGLMELKKKPTANYRDAQ